MCFSNLGSARNNYDLRTNLSFLFLFFFSFIQYLSYNHILYLYLSFLIALSLSLFYLPKWNVTLSLSLFIFYPFSLPLCLSLSLSLSICLFQSFSRLTLFFSNILFYIQKWICESLVVPRKSQSEVLCVPRCTPFCLSLPVTSKAKPSRSDPMATGPSLINRRTRTSNSQTEGGKESDEANNKKREQII